MGPTKLIKQQLVQRQNELIEQLHKEARSSFYDRMMYEINDALTSILAVCDVEAKEAVPKVKQYIHRINQSLHTTKNYQSNREDEQKFNISAVLKNLVHVIEDNYKTAKLTCLLADIKAPVLGRQSQFEKVFLSIFVSMFTNLNNLDSEMLVELRQKDQDAMITILKDNHGFSDDTLKRIDELKESEDFKGSVQITPQGKGVEIIIRLPLQFEIIDFARNPSKKVTATGIRSLSRT